MIDPDQQQEWQDAELARRKAEHEAFSRMMQATTNSSRPILAQGSSAPTDSRVDFSRDLEKTYCDYKSYVRHAWTWVESERFGNLDESKQMLDKAQDAWNRHKAALTAAQLAGYKVEAVIDGQARKFKVGGVVA